jgi:hypothetical protein
VDEQIVHRLDVFRKQTHVPILFFDVFRAPADRCGHATPCARSPWMNEQGGAGFRLSSGDLRDCVRQMTKKPLHHGPG